MLRWSAKPIRTTWRPRPARSTALALGDALAIALMCARHFTPEEFGRFHPGGQLGRNLRPCGARGHARRRRSRPWCAPEAPLKEVIIAMTRRPLGGACVVAADGALAGFLTDGDLRRALTSHDDIRGAARRRRHDAARPSPSAPTPRLGEALERMERRASQISVLPVVDDAGRALGLLRLHDIYLGPVSRSSEAGFRQNVSKPASPAAAVSKPDTTTPGRCGRIERLGRNSGMDSVSASLIHELRPRIVERRERLEAAARALSAAYVNDLLAEIDAALRRIDDGTYGLCEACHETIEADRLELNPLLRFCLDHLSEKELRDHEQDLELATQIQAGLLPAKDIAAEDWETHYRYEPAGVVGGDYCELVRPAMASPSSSPSATWPAKAWPHRC